MAEVKKQLDDRAEGRRAAWLQGREDCKRARQAGKIQDELDDASASNNPSASLQHTPQRLPRCIMETKAEGHELVRRGTEMMCLRLMQEDAVIPDEPGPIWLKRTNMEFRRRFNITNPNKVIAIQNWQEAHHWAKWERRGPSRRRTGLVILGEVLPSRVTKDGFIPKRIKWLRGTLI